MQPTKKCKMVSNDSISYFLKKSLSSHFKKGCHLYQIYKTDDEQMVYGNLRFGIPWFLSKTVDTALNLFSILCSF